VVTGGPEGSAAAGHGLTIAVSPDAPVTVMLDATGAGDAYAASMIAVLLDSPWPPAAAAVSNAMRHAGERGALVSQVIGAQGRIAGEPDPVP
jgi:sugar/nucleoside kinase (ribokinase family)